MILKYKFQLIPESSTILKRIFSVLLISSLLMLSACDESGSEDTSTDLGSTISESEITNSDSDTSSVVDDSSETIIVDDSNFETTDWTEATHSKSAAPDFDEVFDSSQVKRLDMVITTERWKSMLDDMTSLYGEFGALSVDINSALSDADLGGPELGGPGGAILEQEIIADTDDLVDDTEDPIFVPGDVYYNDIQWYKVGLRFKGNSSLKSSWEQGILKLSFKLDFDEYEDDYPQIDNQRFYGFKKLSLKNNYEDQSLLREKVAADVFKNAGLVVSHTAFYALYIDHGNGPVYFGLYTLVEEVNDTVIDEQFGDDGGNLYKPEGDGASFVEGAFDEAHFEKKTNENEADWSDIEALFTALHAVQEDSTTWRDNLNAVFDTDIFLKYLAVNGLMQNWDTYGRMTHNFYLYNDPDSGKLIWIPWDNNEALQEGKLGGSLALDFSNIESDAWPLIEKIMADDVYKEKYDLYVSEVMTSAFEAGVMQDLYDYYEAMVEDYAIAEETGYTFLNGVYSDAINELKVHATERNSAAVAYLE